MSGLRTRSLRNSLQLGALAVLLGVAIAYFALPARAAESCREWRSEMVEDEGGPVLMAMACSDDASESMLSLACADSMFFVSYDLVRGSDRQPELEAIATVEFVTDGGVETLSLQYQEMDGMFAGETRTDGVLARLLASQSALLVRDDAGLYPAKTFSLRGSAAALSRLAAGCRS